jgi:hypothetical protein
MNHQTSENGTLKNAKKNKILLIRKQSGLRESLIVLRHRVLFSHAVETVQRPSITD